MQFRLWKQCIIAVIAFLFVRHLVLAKDVGKNPTTVRIDASRPGSAPLNSQLRMGGVSREGHKIGVNSRYLTFDNKPWLPVMGEFHYSRYPEQYWEEELLKMKAGGVRVIATYVFWIHHEEMEGQFDWSGRRNLRRFLELCQKDGLRVHVRIGPYAHGEVRNGGLPDWLLKKGPVRTNDLVYLSYVRRYYGAIGQQLKGLLWKDGGPVIGIQFENEYYDRSPNGGAAHIAELKKIAQQSGIEAPIYTVTGWGNPDFPAGEVIPVFGAYPDAFWESTLTDQPPSAYYQFDILRDIGDVGVAQGSSTIREDQLQAYPFLMAEAGGGMQVAYHRRPVIRSDDVAALMLTRLGSGANLYGYYMFQGGSNPEGKLTTLQESEASDHVYDLPVVSYDFQAPLGEFGQMNPHFRAIKLFGLFLDDFGDQLAPMIPVAPQVVPASAEDTLTPRVAARVQGDRGFLFFNGYQRIYPLPEHKNLQIELQLPSETLTVPRFPINVPSGAYFVWPVNLELGGTLLKYATAQLLTRVQAGNTEYYFFHQQPGIVPEFVFDDRTVASAKAPKGILSRSDGRLYVSGLESGADIAVFLRSRTGTAIEIVVLNPQQAENTWKTSFRGREHVFLSSADVFFEQDRMHLRARDVGKLHFSVFPNLVGVSVEGASVRQSGRSGIFWDYTAAVRPKEIPIRWKKIREADPSMPVKKGKYNALAPTDSDFDRAGVWHVVLPKDAMQGVSDVFLRVNYAGDVARLYAGHHLLADDFFAGAIWEIGLKRYASEALPQGVDVKLMPLRKDATIYLPQSPWPDFPSTEEIAAIRGITAVPEYEVVVLWKP